MKKHNFYAGPSILPEYTKQKVAEAAMDFAGTGLSVMEVSHRGKEFIAVMDEAVALVKELLNVPEGYSVFVFTRRSKSPVFDGSIQSDEIKISVFKHRSLGRESFKGSKLLW